MLYEVITDQLVDHILCDRVVPVCTYARDHARGIARTQVVQPGQRQRQRAQTVRHIQYHRRGVTHDRVVYRHREPRCRVQPDRDRRVDARITSYNVCYTKLLRLLSVGASPEPSTVLHRKSLSR